MTATSKSSRYWALKRLAQEYRPYKYAIALVLILGTVVSLIQPFCAKLTERVVDELQVGTSQEFLLATPLVLILAFVVSGVAKYFYNTIRRTISQDVVCTLRARLFEKFVSFPMPTLQGGRTGDYLSNMQNDLVQVEAGMETACDMVKEPVAFIGLLGVAFYCDWKLATATLLIAPIVTLFFSKTGQAVKSFTERGLGQFSDLVSLSQESLVGAPVVKVFQLEKTLTEKFRRIQDLYFINLKKSIRIQEVATPVVELIGALLIAAVLAYGGYRISQGAMTSGQLIAFVIAIGLAQMPVKKLNSAFIRLKIAEAAAERIFTALENSESDFDVPDSVSLSHFEESIRFENVSLWYGTKQALSEVSFDVQRGECVAFVGFSGSGKSSIVNLLPRLYTPTSGRVVMDGVDLRKIKTEDLRALFSIVSQETFLFNDSIYENIRYGSPRASKKEVLRAAEQAHCLDFINKFPEGLETRVGERGAQLSGGERQRVAIARALLKKAPILILDEATSSLDSQSEAVVQDALESLMVGKTTFMIAHRFATVRRADRIYVISEGKLSETGTHTDLVASKGVYARLFEQQFAPQLSAN